MPRIIGATLSEHREETRRRLFTALARLLEERGFDAVSLADIAAEAGVGRTAVYNHVPDKETLLLDYIADETDRWLRELQAALADVADPVAQVRLYVRHQLRMRRSFHMPAGLRAALSPEGQARLHHHARPVEAVLRDIVTAGVEAGVFVRQPVDVAVGLVNACLIARVAIGEGGEQAGVEDFVLRALGAGG